MYKMYSLGAFGHKYELITFCGQKVKCQGHSQTTYEKHFLTYLRNVWINLMKCVIITNQVHMTHFKVMGTCHENMF